MEAWWVNSKMAYSDWSDLSANQRDFFYHAGFFVFKADVLWTSRRILYTRMKFVGGETKTITEEVFEVLSRKWDFLTRMSMVIYCFGVDRQRQRSYVNASQLLVHKMLTNLKMSGIDKSIVNMSESDLGTTTLCSYPFPVWCAKILLPISRTRQ